MRFFAALTVFVAHISGARFTAGLFWRTEPYANEAVIVFFVLSGFVIAYVAERSEVTPRAFAVARLARIYSVALPALVMTFALDAIGRTMRPELYNASWGYVLAGQWQQFLTSLFFVNRLGWLDIKEGSDVSYWSLSYEVWYYIIFAAAFFGRGPWKIVLTLVALGIAGPNILALFPLWLLGAATYRLCRRDIVGRKLGAFLCFGPLALWLAYEMLAWHGHRLDDVVPYPLFHRTELAQDYLVALLFAAHLVGFRAVSPLFAPLLTRFSKEIRWAAGATFTIYLFHVPLCQFLAAVLPWPPSAWPTRVAMFPGALVLMFLIAEYTERRKEFWRRMFTVVLPSPDPKAMT